MLYVILIAVFAYIMFYAFLWLPVIILLETISEMPWLVVWLKIIGGYLVCWFVFECIMRSIKDTK